MRDILIEARIRSELWRAYALTQARAGAAPASRRGRKPLRRIFALRRAAAREAGAPPD